MAGGEEESNKAKIEAAKIPKIDFTSPYYLGSNDSPGNTITTVVFHGDNYEEWSRSIRLSLLARRKFGFLDGSIKKPTDDAQLVDWHCVQAMLVQWIMHTLDKSVKQTIPYFEEAKPLWDMLRDRFSIRNGLRIQQLKTTLAECRQSKTMSVVEYFGQLQILWDELGTYEPIPACRCDGCRCNIQKQLQQRVDEAQFHQFLYGINAELYSNVCSNLLSQDPFPSLARAYQTLVQEERLRNSTRATPERDEVMTFAVKSQANNSRGMPRSDSRDKSELICSYCHRTRHDEANCFAKNGFPDWWGDRPRGGRGFGKGRSGASIDSSNNVGKGKIGEVRATGGKAAEVRAMLAGNSAPSGATDEAVLPGITNAQWQQLLDMLGNVNLKPNDDRLAGPKYEDPDWSR